MITMMMVMMMNLFVLKLQLQFLKLILGVKVTTHMVLGELGRCPT